MFKIRKLKRILSMICVVCMLISMLSTGSVAFAEDNTTVKDTNLGQSEETGFSGELPEDKGAAGESKDFEGTSESMAVLENATKEVEKNTVSTNINESKSEDNLESLNTRNTSEDVTKELADEESGKEKSSDSNTLNKAETESKEDTSLVNTEEKTNKKRESIDAVIPSLKGSEAKSTWELGVVFYDSTVDGGLTPLKEIDWDASDGGYGVGETRTITMQITYRNTNVEQDYEPGDVTISIPSPVYNTTGNESFKPNWDITKLIVGANDNTHTGYNWNFVSGGAPTTGQKEFSFVNSATMEAGSNFEGSIQIVFEVNPRAESTNTIEKYEDSCTHNYNYRGQAILSYGEDQEKIISNEVQLDYTRTYIHPWDRAEFDLKKSASEVKNPGELMSEGAEDYYWVKYTFTYNEPSRADIYPWIFSRSYDIVDSFPEECVVLDRNGAPIVPNDDGEYIITQIDDLGYSSSSIPGWGVAGYINRKKVCYVGYPKSEYNQENGNLDIQNEAGLLGQYADKNEKDILAVGNVALNLNDYQFEYPPGSYNIYKTTSSNSMYYNNIISGEILLNRNYTSWQLRPVANYSGKKMDIEFGDDVLFYLNDQNKYVKIQDDDYCFRTITLSTLGKTSDSSNYWVNESGTVIPAGKYDVELYIRKAGESDYTLYETFKNRNKGTWNFMKSDKVVGFYFVVKDMTEGLCPNTSLCTCQTQFYMQDIPKAGTLYNFDYIKAYLDNGTGEKIFANEPGLDSYATFATQTDIATFDQDTYGEYRMRARSSNAWTYLDPHIANRHQNTKSASALVQDEAKERFTGEYTIRYSFISRTRYEEIYHDFYHPEERVSKFDFYDLLPRGVDLEASDEEILSSLIIRFSGSNNLFFDSDWNPISEDDILEMLKEHMEVTVTPNWQETGRTHVAVKCNFEDMPFYSFSKTNSDAILQILAYIPFSISYDSYLEYGKTYVNRCYSDALYVNGDRINANVNSCSDDGKSNKEETDIDGNGAIEKNFCRGATTVNITSIVSTHQSIEKTIMTPNTDNKFVSGKANAEIGEEYSYRIRVRTGRADVTNLVVYDSIERYVRKNDGFVSSSGGVDYWLGSFLGVDTSHPESKGYTVRVWCSPSEQPGKLGEDSSWKLYLGETDNESVRALAFEYLDKDGNSAILPAASVSFLYIRMKAPSVGYETKLAYNGAYSDWTALDSFGTPVDYITGMNSNIVRVSLSDTIEYSVEKTWVGTDGEQLPDDIAVQLLRDNRDYGEPVIISAENEWKYTFTDLPKYNDEGTLYKYTVKEVPVEGYICYITQNGEEATLINVPLTSVSVKKEWIDDSNNSGKRPDEIVLQLCQTINGVTSEVYGKTITLKGEGNQWSSEINDLPAYTQAGDAITYSFIEKEVPKGYSVSISEDGFTITNTITGKVSIPVEKTWVGPAAESVTIRLFYDGLEYDSVVLSEANDWQYVFKDLDKYDPTDGHEVNYDIQEDVIPGYDTKVIDSFEDGVTFINTNTETIDIPVEKKWVGPELDSVTANLLADGEEVDSVVLTDEDNWKYTFKDLIRYDGTDGHEIEYTIEELIPEGYEAEITGDKSGFTITNTNTETIDIPVEKEWIGPALDSVTVNLLSDGEVLCDADLNKDNDWQYTFTDLPKYDGTDGHEIDYTISEDSVENYSSEISGNADEGFVVTNTNVETVSVEGIKVWDDNDDQDVIRPESITVRLMANGIEIDNRTVSEDDDWKWSFDDLPKYDNGEEISYDIAEDDVDGYVSEITQDVESQYVITNYHEPGMIDISVNKIWKDYNDKLGKRPDSITIRLLADGESTGDSIILNEDNGWSGNFSYLDKYRDDKLITYSISEDVVKGYTSSIKGSAEDGFTVTNKVITGAPKTGDGTNVIKYFCLILISVMGIICMLAKPKRRKAKVNK